MNEHDLNESGMKAALEDLMDAIPKSAHPKIIQAIKAKQTKQIADILKVNRVKSKFNEKESAQIVMDYFMDYFGPLESVVEDGDIVEKVDLDARTGPFRRTVERLSYQRGMREGKLKENKWGGLYNDGTGRGVSIPEPIDFNKENRRFEKEVDGRIRAFKEAMKRVETYKKLRETKKKMIAGQKSVKEELVLEAIDMKAANEFLDDLEKAYKKGGLKGMVSTGGSSGRDDLQVIDFIENLSKYMKGASPAVMKHIKKEIAGMVKPADMARISKYVKETFDMTEAADMVTKAGVEMIGDDYAISEEDLSPAQKKYRAFFQKALKKFGADSPADLDDAKKKEFFNYIKTNYKESADILPPHGKTLDEEELSKKQKEYRAFFDKALKKFGAESPAKMDDAQKKKFFNYVKTNWKG